MRRYSGFIEVAEEFTAVINSHPPQSRPLARWRFRISNSEWPCLFVLSSYCPGPPTFLTHTGSFLDSTGERTSLGLILSVSEALRASLVHQPATSSSTLWWPSIDTFDVCVDACAAILTLCVRAFVRTTSTTQSGMCVRGWVCINLHTFWSLPNQTFPTPQMCVCVYLTQLVGDFHATQAPERGI